MFPGYHPADAGLGREQAALGQAAREKANRNLAMTYSDHDRRRERALAVRGDIYTYDTLAWSLYKNKRYDEAAQAIEEALRLGTPEPMFYYHAGMIAYALGEKDKAAGHLKHALTLNPKFDVKQAPVAASTLEALSKDAAL